MVPKLCSVICSEMITVSSLQTKATVKWKGFEKWKMLSFTGKRLYNLLYKPENVLLFLLSLWKSINNHS